MTSQPIAPETTITFNAGGTHYEVSRSLIEKYPQSMLARLISDTWQSDKQDKDAPIFLDCDGERFRYVLDYMRYEKVHLPLSVCKATILQDLDYFNIIVVRGEQIVGGSAKAEVARQMAQIRKEHEQQVKTMYLSKLYMTKVYELFIKYSETGRFHYGLNISKFDENKNNGFDEKLLQECLESYGFTMRWSKQSSHGLPTEVAVGLLDDPGLE